MSKRIDVTVPDLGDFSDIPVIELLVSEGESVEKDQALLVLESDKSTLEVPAPESGVVSGLKVKLGDNLSTGSSICQLELSGGQEEAAAPESSPAVPNEEPVANAPSAPAAPAPTSGGGGSIDVTVPDLGEFSDIPVIELLVSEGEAVEKDQALLVLESDKSTLEVPAPEAGTVTGLKVKLGDTLSTGSEICKLSTGGGAAPSAAPAESASAPPAGDGGGSTVSMTVPDLGDFSNIPVIELLVAVGDSVTKDQALLVLESDKSTLEIPATADGVVTSLAVKLGDTVSQGDALLEIASSGGGSAPAAPAAPKAAPAVAPTKAPAKAAPEASAPPAKSGGKPSHAGPATRRFARELGVDLSEVTGTGAKGRVVIEDVQKFVKSRMTGSGPAKSAAGSADGGMGIPPIPVQDFSLYGEIEEKPLARIRKLSAAHLHRAWLNIPHVTQNDDVDITELEAFRKASNKEGTTAKLTLLPFVMKAVASAIRELPEFGCSLSPDGQSLIMKNYCHVGFAADTPNGLVVPVVRDVWGKGIAQLAVETAELAKKARDGKLKPDEMRGGCFSISSLGGIGGSNFTPIVNAPEVAILGVSRSSMKPIWDGASFQPRLMAPLSLSYDHRVIDGANAARFIVLLGKYLGDIRRLTL